jgi:hypothetical protein
LLFQLLPLGCQPLPGQRGQWRAAEARLRRLRRLCGGQAAPAGGRVDEDARNPTDWLDLTPFDGKMLTDAEVQAILAEEPDEPTPPEDLLPARFDAREEAEAKRDTLRQLTPRKIFEPLLHVLATVAYVVISIGVLSGWAYWLFVSVKLDSFVMFIFGIFGGMRCACFIIRAVVFALGVPHWLLHLVAHF